MLVANLANLQNW